MGRRRNGRGAGRRERELARKFYALRAPQDERGKDEDDPGPAEELRRLRAQAREIIRLHPGNARMWRVAADVLLRAARIEHSMKGTDKQSREKAILDVFEYLDSQLNPERWRLEEKDPDRVAADEPEMAAGEE